MALARDDIPAVPLVRTDSTEPVVAGRYELVSVLGSGGMGTVWQARDRRLDRTVALKVMRDDLPPGTAQQLELEARAAARIADHRVVTVLDLDRTSDGRPFLVLECHDGDTLASLLRDGPLDEDGFADLADDLLGALAAAHGCGVLHRDIKPANVLVGPEGFRVTDFGLASLDGDTSTETDLMGTLVYVAPERLDGARGTPRSDVFSAAAVLYEAATGVQPFRAPGAADSIARLRSGDYREAPSHLSGPARQVLDDALSPDPADRPVDAAAFRDALLATLDADSTQDRTEVIDATGILPLDTTVPSDRPLQPRRARVPAPTPGASVFAPAGPVTEPAATGAWTGEAGARTVEVVASAAATLRRRPDVVIIAVAVTLLIALFAVTGLASDTPSPQAPPQDAAPADGPGSGPDGSLASTLDRIEELGR